MNDEDHDSTTAGDAAAAGRLAAVLQPDAIDALLADAKAAGTPIDGVDGLLNQMTKAVDVEGRKHALGVWIAEAEGAKFWHSVLTQLRNRA